MTEKTSAPTFAQRDHTPASRAQVAAGTFPVQAVADASKHPDKAAQLMAAFGTTHHAVVTALLEQLAMAGLRGGDVDEANFTFMVEAVHGIRPRDPLEIMLTAQMAAVHIATMTSARRLRTADNIQKQDIAERAFNKLARTFATQMEALTRYRTGGEQKVMVQHVSVSDGGQAAIVGNVTQAPRGSAGNGPASGT